VRGSGFFFASASAKAFSTTFLAFIFSLHQVNARHHWPAVKRSALTAALRHLVNVPII
jgi:hypothetical protein